MATLTERQKRFVENYQTSGNASEAARLAGYKSPEVEGCRLLKNAKVVTALTTHTENRAVIAGITRQAKKERLQNIIEGEDDKLSMQAIDIDNKMEAEYVQRQEVALSIIKDKTDAEIEEMFIDDLRARGYVVIAPNE